MAFLDEDLAVIYQVGLGPIRTCMVFIYLDLQSKQKLWLLHPLRWDEAMFWGMLEVQLGKEKCSLHGELTGGVRA